MNILWANYILIGVYALLSQFLNKKNRKRYFLILCAVQLILLFALRDITVGIDLIRYERTYNYIAQNPLKYALILRENYSNIGYFFYNFILAHLGVSYQAFLGLVGIIAVLPLCLLIYNYSKHPYLSLLFYLSMGIYAFQFSGLKQTIAMSLVILAFICIEKNNWKWFYLLTIIAILFHPTAIVVLPMYWILKTNKVKMIIGGLVFILFITYIFRLQFGALLMTLYASDYLGRYQVSGSIGGMSIFLILIIIFIVLFAQKGILNTNKEISVYFRLLLICLAIQLISSYAYAFTRVNYYYIQFLPIVISNIVDLPKLYNSKSKLMKSISFFLWIIFFILSCIMYKNSIINGTNTLNYVFYF